MVICGSQQPDELVERAAQPGIATRLTKPVKKQRLPEAVAAPLTPATGI